MKRGWLIYDNEGAKRNEWFIAECQKKAEEQGLQLSLQIFDGVLPSGPYPDFALVRTISPRLSAHLVGAGTRIFNNFAVSAVANDKWLTYQAVSGLGLPTMPTAYAAETSKTSPYGYPVVLKSRAGHGGAEVFKIDNEKAYRAFFKTHAVEDYIVQKLCSEVGVDMRVYMLGGEMLAAVLRRSETDFRSNFSLGGEVSLVDPPTEICEMVETLQVKFAFDFVGVDFIRDEGKWVLNEIEDVVGSRMLYQTANIDVAGLYLQHVANTMKQTR